MYGCATSVTGGMYFNEMSASFDGRNTRQSFDFKSAYEHMLSLRNRKNFWEQKRAEAFGLK